MHTSWNLFQKSFQKLSLSDKVKLRKDAGDNGKKYQVDEDALDLNYAEKFPVPQSTLKNENISNATDKIKIDINSSFGLHIVADKDIEIGKFSLSFMYYTEYRNVKTYLWNRK